MDKYISDVIYSYHSNTIDKKIYFNEKYKLTCNNIIDAYIKIYNKSIEEFIKDVYDLFISDKINIHCFYNFDNKYDIVIDVISEYISFGNIRSRKND